MMLLDQERQSAKEAVADLSRRLTAANEKVQAHREQIIEHEAAIRQLTDRNDALTTVVDEKVAENAELSSSLENQRAQQNVLQREFAAYKDEHRISGDLEALQAAVVGLQKKLEEKQEE
jgi:chromosome segregation ATPase